MSLKSWLITKSAPNVTVKNCENNNKPNYNIERCENDDNHVRSVKKQKCSSPSEGSSNNNANFYHIPDCWSYDMYLKKIKEYPWLIIKDKKVGCAVCKKTGKLSLNNKSSVRISSEANCCVSVNGKNKSEQQQSLRKKIHKHKNAEGHNLAKKLSEEAELHKIEESINVLNQQDMDSISNIFRIVYNIAKKGRPFTDLPFDVICNKLNKVQVGRVNHSDHACANIINFIASEMRKKVFGEIIKNKCTIGILIDESTSVSHKATLAICLRAALTPVNEPIMIFLSLVELENASSEVIVSTTLKELDTIGFSNEYLEEHLISFCSDGASNMVGHKSGVAFVLKKKFPALIVWHCANHKLELAVGDTVKDITGLNHLKIFIDKLYCLFSPKNRNELLNCASELGIRLLAIGKILDTRWVASSLRTVRAIWNNYPALYIHFSKKENLKATLKKELILKD